jgi:diguanylate cyclase (GGDEF)-like protein/PAS domain S-box-containing protein
MQRYAPAFDQRCRPLLKSRLAFWRVIELTLPFHWIDSPLHLHITAADITTKRTYREIKYRQRENNMEQTTERSLIHRNADYSNENPSKADAISAYDKELAPLLQTERSRVEPNVDTQSFLALLAKQPIIIFSIDREGIFTLSEGQNLKYLGLTAGQVVGKAYAEVYQDFPKTMAYIRRALNGEDLTCVEHFGDLIFETHLTPLYDAGTVSGVIGLARDIKDRVLAEEALQARERLFRTLIEQTTDLIFILDAVGMYRFASPSHSRVLGYAPEDLLGSNIFELLHPVDLADAFPILVGAFQSSGTTIQLEMRLKRADDSWIILECVGHNCLHDPAIEGLVLTAHNITQRKAMEEQLRHLALHDSLTDLPNRLSLQEQSTQAISHAAQVAGKVALLVLGLNRFKEVNNAFGHHFGDILLQQIGLRLSQTISNAELVARLGGDEFAILLPVANPAYAQQVIEKVHTVLKEPISVGEYLLPAEVSIGAALYPEHGTDALTLLQHADVAMYSAKQVHERSAFYDASHDQETLRRLTLMSALPSALANHELQLYYQPKVQVSTMRVYGAEALVRWISPDYGLIPPDQFIPLAEQTGFIRPLTQWVLETAVQQCRRWLDVGLQLSIAVNISAWNLREAALPDTIAALLEWYHVSPHLLRIEVTESAVMTDLEKALDVLDRIATLGIPISVDDFGAGQSSLAYLKRFPIDELKIDHAFVRHMATNQVDATIVRSTILLAHSLDLKVVAEGVEDQAALDLLASYQCDTLQGYFLSRPIPVQDFEKWVQGWEGAHSVMM